MAGRLRSARRLLGNIAATSLHFLAFGLAFYPCLLSSKMGDHRRRRKTALPAKLLGNIKREPGKALKPYRARRHCLCVLQNRNRLLSGMRFDILSDGPHGFYEPIGGDIESLVACHAAKFDIGQNVAVFFIMPDKARLAS